MKRSILIGFAGSLLLASAAVGQQPRGQQSDSVAGMRGRAMMGHMTMATMDSADARLDRLVRTMNARTGGKKVQAMAAVLNELVAQRKMMRMHARKMMGSGMMMMGAERRGDMNRMQSMGPTFKDSGPPPAPADTSRAQPRP
jgi:hypothetical protein